MHAITKYFGFGKQIAANRYGPGPINYCTLRNFCKSKPRPTSIKLINGNSWTSQSYFCQNLCQPYVYGRSTDVGFMTIRGLKDHIASKGITLRLGHSQNRNFIHLRSFKTSSVNLAPPLLIIIGKTVAKFVAVISGRGFRKWWKGLPDDKRVYFMEVIKSNHFKIIGALTVLSVMMFVYYESHMAVSPITKRKRFIAFTQSQFDEIADFEFKMQYETLQPLLLPSNHSHYERVSRVIQRILEPYRQLDEVKNKNWAIAIVGTEDENAFVLPKGQIFVFEGILKMCSNDDQLAVILAHEISHCILGHAAENLSFSHIIDFGIIVAIAAIWALLPSDAVALVTQYLFHKIVQLSVDLPFNRKLEKEADEVGLQLLANACFDVRECSAFWAKMSLKNGDEVEWLSTHPSNENRSVYLDTLMDNAVMKRKVYGCSELSNLDPRDLIKEFKKKLQNEKVRQTMVDVVV